MSRWANAPATLAKEVVQMHGPDRQKARAARMRLRGLPLGRIEVYNSSQDGGISDLRNMVASVEQYLGLGLYSPAEAALYARVQAQLIVRWVHGSAVGRPAIRAQIENPEEKTITFLDFIQTLAIREIRETKKVPLNKIREAVELAKEKGIDYPFARKHTTYLCGNDVFLEIPDLGLLQATGKHARQLAMRPILESYLEDLSYGTTGLAVSYTVDNRNNVKIVMDPEQHFGEPILPSCGYSARTLWHACRTEGGFEAAAKGYGVSDNEVRVAYRYFDSLRTACAD